MSAPLHRIIEIAVRGAAGQPHREQARILQDCYDLAPDGTQIRRDLQRLGTLIDTAEAEFLRFEADPDDEQI